MGKGSKLNIINELNYDYVRIVVDMVRTDGHRVTNMPQLITLSWGRALFATTTLH